MKASEYGDILNRAQELDERRQQQIAKQKDAITDFVGFLEEKGLMSYFNEWKERRGVG